MSSLHEQDYDDESIYVSSENEEVADDFKFDISTQLSQWAIAHSVTQIALSYYRALCVSGNAGMQLNSDNVYNRTPVQLCC